MINYIWAFFIVIGVFYSIYKGDTNLSNTLLTSGKTAIDMIFSIGSIICLWLGIMNIAKKSGLLDILSNKLSPLVRLLFPEIPKGDPAIGYISLNIVMNMMGLGNAATPFGLKTMKELKRLNNNSDVASRSMITFLVINTASVTIIPTTIISLRVLNGSSNPNEIISSCIITTFLSVVLALIIDRLFYYLWRKRYV